MEGFITWANLQDYGTFVTLVFMAVEFTKALPYVDKVPTKYWSALIAFALLVINAVHNNNFNYNEIALYILSAITVSLGANGLAQFNKVNTNPKQ